MRFAFTFALVCLLAIGCQRRDARLEKIAGAWQPKDGGWEVSFSPSGGFTTRWPSLTYQGTWLLSADEVVMTVTNVTGTVQHEPVGSVDRLRIIQLDSYHMIFAYQAASNLVATNTYVRRP